jgi:type IV secretory pathway VirB6-like protein
MGLLGYAVVVCVTISFLFYVIMAKIALSVLLVLAPVILPLYLWQATQPILHGWVRVLIKWAFAPIFVYLFAAIFISSLQNQIDTLNKPGVIANTAEISMFILVGLLAVLTFKQAGNISSSLASSVSWKDKNPQQWLKIPNAFFNSWR